MRVLLAGFIFSWNRKLIGQPRCKCHTNTDFYHDSLRIPGTLHAFSTILLKTYMPGIP